MIKEAQNKALKAPPRSKENEAALEEWYFSADDGRPPVTICASSFAEAVEEYNRKFNLSQE